MARVKRIPIVNYCDDSQELLPTIINLQQSERQLWQILLTFQTASLIARVNKEREIQWTARLYLISLLLVTNIIYSNVRNYVFVSSFNVNTLNFLTKMGE